MRKLIVNADDFGFTRDVNAGIVEAHQQGILTATTLMANGQAFDDAVRLAALNPRLDVGVHLVLIQGHSLLDPSRALPETLPQLIRAVYSGELNIYEEFAAQVRKIRGAGLRPLHADTHKHTHLLPPVRRAACAVAREFGIRWLRKPADMPLEYRQGFTTALTSQVMRRVVPALERDVRNAGLRVTDHFTGFAWTGKFVAKDLEWLFGRLPEGITELMVHPGRCTDELRAAPTRLKECREQELAALTAPSVRAALDRSGVELTRYRDMPAL